MFARLLKVSVRLFENEISPKKDKLLCFSETIFGDQTLVVVHLLVWQKIFSDYLYFLWDQTNVCLSENIFCNDFWIAYQFVLIFSVKIQISKFFYHSQKRKLSLFVVKIPKETPTHSLFFMRTLWSGWDFLCFQHFSPLENNPKFWCNETEIS